MVKKYNKIEIKIFICSLIMTYQFCALIDRIEKYIIKE